MSIGIFEVALFVVVVVATLAAVAWTKNWLYLGIIAVFGLAVVVTPADPVSALLVGVPLCAVYGFTVRRA